MTHDTGRPRYEPGEVTAEPMGFQDYATCFEQIGRIYDEYNNGKIGAREAMEAIHEQVGDRPERLGDAS